MGSLIPITYLNDFIFCPRSIYFHGLYKTYSTNTYHSDVQVKGLKAHQSIDCKKYSTRQHILQGYDVVSTVYGLVGKIDIFDCKSGVLTERKKKIRQVYDGYVFQLYGQYFGLMEANFKIKRLQLRSLDDNKTWPIDKPEDNPVMLERFQTVLKQIHSFRLSDPVLLNEKKCQHCIYSQLCDAAPC